MNSQETRFATARGPYWWLLKKTLISAGCTAFGEYIDQEWYDRLAYENEQYNIAAAYVYSDWACSSGYFYASEHPYVWRNTELEESYGDEEIWEEGTYYLFDEDMERSAVLKRALKH